MEENNFMKKNELQQAHYQTVGIHDKLIINPVSYTHLTLPTP